MEVDKEAQIGQELDAPNAIFHKTVGPVTLKFEDVFYKIKTRKSSILKPSSSKMDEKLILKGNTGIVNPGEMLAMMGPSGSGKTTLLTALGGRHRSGTLTGSITYNNQPYSAKTKRFIGFVTQDDVLYAHLTVYETLQYTALLRLPNTLTKAQKAKQAELVISQLGLSKCKNSIVGGPFLRGISGGERKRVSIGQEMLVNPSLLFLDEPTSGLDSTTAQRIVSTLADVARGGRTILMTIHQPSSRLFYMFHKVLLLSEGNTVYFGSGSEVMEYFKSIGFEPSVPMNPADFLLDLANGVSPDDSEDQTTVKEKLITSYKTTLAGKVKSEAQEHRDNGGHNGSDGWLAAGNNPREVGKWPITWWQQFDVLLRRGIKERKHESFDTLKIVQVLVVAFLSGLLWWHSSTSRIQDQVGLLFFYSGFWGFFPLFEAIFAFPPERMMLEKERTSGMYRLSSYFMSRLLSDLPMELVLPTVFLIISYWMAGLKYTAGAFLYILFTLLLYVLVAQGLGLALGALVMDQKKATVLGSVIMLTFLLAGGYYVQHVPGFISWIKYLSISNYTYKLFVGSQYSPGETYPCGPDNKQCLIEDFPAIKAIGLRGQLSAAVALVLMLIGYRLLAYLALMRIGVTGKSTS